MGKADFIGGLAIAIFGVLLIFVIIPQGTEQGVYYGLSPTFFPTIMASGMTLCAFGLAFQGWRRLRAEAAAQSSPTPNPVSRWNLLMFLLAAGIAIVGVIAIDFIGMIYAAPVLIAALLLFLGERNLIIIALTSTLPVAVVYLMAAHVLRTPLP
jgi:hypothetical protein